MTSLTRQQLCAALAISESTVRRLVKLATQDGYIITIEQRPLHPLAMGHHKTVVEVRENWELAKP